MGETPGPIPNPEAKTHSADGTAPGRVWESRTPPDNHYTVEAPTTRLGPPALNNTTTPHHHSGPNTFLTRGQPPPLTARPPAGQERGVAGEGAVPDAAASGVVKIATIELPALLPRRSDLRLH